MRETENNPPAAMQAGAASPLSNRPVGLKRALGLPLLVLYGLGVTIGAGIYVLIGATAGRAGIYAPIAFVNAAVVMAFTAASFAELTVRLPVSAGEAAYVRAGLKSATLSLLVGLMVIAAGSVSAAAISVGSAGYIRVFLALPDSVIVPAVILLLGTIAAWGISQSVMFAAAMTLTEVGGLILVIATGLYHDPDIALRLHEVIPDPVDIAAWSGVLAAGLLAFFAFIGFEDLVNIAEEAESPERTLPWAILLTLVISTVFYFAVVSVAVLSVPAEELAAAEAPLSLVIQRLTGASPFVISAIAIIATLNGVIVQIIMASRVVYGLSMQQSLPALLSRVHPVTRTPLIATALVVAIIVCLAMIFPIEPLAEATSTITLTVFALVNLSLIRIKLSEAASREGGPASEGFRVPLWVPIAGLVTTLAFLVSSLAL